MGWYQVFVRFRYRFLQNWFPVQRFLKFGSITNVVCFQAQHPNIVTVREIVVGSNMDKIFIVMDYVEHDLKSLMETMKHKKQVFLPGWWLYNQ